MMKLSMNELTTYRWSFEEDVQHYSALGVPGIGVWRQKLADFGEEKGIELLSESSLKVSCLLWAGGFTGCDGQTFRESIQDAQEAICLAAAMKAGCVIVYSGARGGHTQNHSRRLMKNALIELAPCATEFNVPLAIKPMHHGCAAEWTFLTDLENTLSLIDEMDSPLVKLAFDTYHLGQDLGILNRLPDLVQRTSIVQLGDARQPPQGEQDRCLLGTGNIPLQEIVSSFLDSGYDGFFDVELMGQEIELFDYHEIVERSKRVFEKLFLRAGEKQLSKQVDSLRREAW